MGWAGLSWARLGLAGLDWAWLDWVRAKEMGRAWQKLGYTGKCPGDKTYSCQLSCVTFGRLQSRALCEPWHGMWVMGLDSEGWSGHSVGEHLPTQNTPCAVSDEGMWGLCWPGVLCCLRDK